ncbi:hypothetical protein [Noviherbaspirillum suwonense]|uniref:Uncharacterized protein n=1 Tax=Noviherbaspirillum suwonense TaxID=1224511 RepID=A0ABY1Q2U5_9BURK|nr:hypothetical protein [Noviherbaspirillum suwonense]SMP54415.1 hypothetical protein SAMN06295970_1049 [Noviherbaspirillum suwonense]
MAIVGLRLLPSMAIGRFGSSEHPLEAYELRFDENDPLGYRKIVPKTTFNIDHQTGEVINAYIPRNIKFRDGFQIRPVAPFIEVFALISDGTLVPLTYSLLEAEGLGLQNIEWNVNVGNLKVFRQTGDQNDKVLSKTGSFNDFELHKLNGICANFLEGKSIDFGSVRFIKPTLKFPEIRLRFIPPAGLVYGSSTLRYNMDENKDVIDPVFVGKEERIVYDTSRGKWRGFGKDNEASSTHHPTSPGDIYHGYWPDWNGRPISWGYLDDVCDGPVTIKLSRNDGTTLRAQAWISSAMPTFAPDSLPLRTVADELEQLILGPDVADEEVSIQSAAEIVRRALESIRFMNTTVMNGNVVSGRSNIARTLGTQDTSNFGREYEPIMAQSLVDNFGVIALHERIYSSLLSGSAPWFADVLRRPEEVGDLSDKGRRKMPPMLRGADGRALTLTRRQISQVVRAAVRGLL